MERSFREWNRPHCSSPIQIHSPCETVSRLPNGIILMPGVRGEAVRLSQVELTSVVTEAEVSRIAAVGNRVIRNLEITKSYADLSGAFRARTGGGADWCTFATWASRQAGSTIRGEDLLDRFERRLGRRAWMLAPVQSLSRMLLRKGLLEQDTTFGRVIAAIHTPFDALERTSAAVAEGNVKVFEEIGREFARFLATVPVDARPDSAACRAFAAGLRAGPPPEGQDYLREAFAHYQQQRFESDAALRAGWILLANLKIGLHEQTRLQPQIAAAVDAPLVTVADLGARVLHILLPGSRRWPRAVHDPAASVVGWIAARIRRDAVAVTREVVTETMMVLALPNGVLSLGRNLDAPVPDVFKEATPPALAEFVKRHDPCAPGTSNCAARDWCDLGQRMHYILHLFRAFADEPSLFSQPFTAEQVARFRAGVVPEGDL